MSNILPMFIIRWIIIALTVFLIGMYLPGVKVESLYTALIVAALFGILNAVIRPLLLILTLPVTLLTLGLSTFVISAVLLWFVASFVEGFSIATFGAALLAAVIIWIVSFVSNGILKAKV